MRVIPLSRPWRFIGNLEAIIGSDIIKGNHLSQNFTVQPIEHHIGVKIKCKGCNDTFDFSAKEQFHWYEELGFWADSVPVECKKCRGKTRTIKRLNKYLGDVLSVKEMNTEDYNKIVKITCELIDNGVIIGGRLAQKIRMAAKRSNLEYRYIILSKVKAT